MEKVLQLASEKEDGMYGHMCIMHRQMYIACACSLSFAYQFRSHLGGPREFAGVSVIIVPHAISVARTSALPWTNHTRPSDDDPFSAAIKEEAEEKKDPEEPTKVWRCIHHSPDYSVAETHPSTRECQQSSHPHCILMRHLSIRQPSTHARTHAVMQADVQASLLLGDEILREMDAQTA